MKCFNNLFNKIFSRKGPVRKVDKAVIEDDEQMELRREMFDKYESELRSRELSNSQQYDKAILTLSSAGFAISVTAFEAIRDHETSDPVLLLTISWWLFFSTIALSLIGFVIGNAAIRRQIKFARDYYIECFKDAVPKTSILVPINSALNILAGITFLTAIGFTIAFFTQTA